MKTFKTAIYQDKYNTLKTWKVEYKNKAYYLSQYIGEQLQGKAVRMTKAQISEIGIFSFELLTEVLNNVVSFVSVEIQNKLQALESDVYWNGEATLLDYDDQFGLIQAMCNHNNAINSLVKFKSFFNLV